MDDGLVLNIAADSDVSAPKASGKGGGRWTDRLKAKRSAKRKVRPDTHFNANKPSKDDIVPPPAKRARKETSTVSPHPVQTSRPPAQIISSLFSYNPRVETPTQSAAPKTTSVPSNAPLADSSSFAGLGLDPLIATHLTSKMNILKPTAIQRAALPALLSTTAQENAWRDIFIQSQTGSGKTLSFLLPIIQDLLPLSTHSYIDRSIGTLAIIIAPTRELAKQISDVLEAILKMRLRPEGEAADDVTPSTRLTRWLVSGLLTGGATRTHEKARLRKGVPILVSTPGRLLDHLQNTSSFNVGKCRWLVLDEADRLMELGFEETITGIIQGLDGRRKLALHAVEEGKSMEVGGWDWERKRRTVLCSATIREDVQKLAGVALAQPLMIKATEVDNPVGGTGAIQKLNHAALATSANPENFTPPSQLSQKYTIVPLKLRLVALIALLRSLIAQHQGRRGTKIIVFISCTDSVDFHWNLLGGSSIDSSNQPSKPVGGSEDDSDGDADDPSDTQDTGDKVAVMSSLLPNTNIYRLHGSLPTPARLASLRGFSSAKDTDGPSSSVLLCTSVASRGLDLPLVRAVIQYDLPTEGGATEYVHRVGRTARAGKGGEAWSIVAPSEAEWVKWVEGKMRGEAKDFVPGDEQRNITLSGVGIESVLKNGFGGKGSEYEKRATEVQLSFERWVLRRKENSELARQAFQSHMRAYTTHPSNEKHIFSIRFLHTGHLAKAFALRDAPNDVKFSTNKKAASRKALQGKRQQPKTATKDEDKKSKAWEADHSGEAEKRMQAIVRSQGRLTKKGGIMMSSGTSEFQIAGGKELEKLVQRG